MARRKRKKPPKKNHWAFEYRAIGDYGGLTCRDSQLFVFLGGGPLLARINRCGRPRLKSRQLRMGWEDVQRGAAVRKEQGRQNQSLSQTPI